MNDRFERNQEVVFGSGAYETLLTEESEPLFADLMRRLRELRRAEGDKRHPLWRMQPERWLESGVKRDVTNLDAQLNPGYVYAQVPAFAAADRGMIDLLASTRDGRLAVIELKADEDIHLPLQGLDYWSRVKWHHEREEFHRFGYFIETNGTAHALSPESALAPVGRSSTAHSSCNGHDPALSLARIGLEPDCSRRTLEGRGQGSLQETSGSIG